MDDSDDEDGGMVVEDEDEDLADIEGRMFAGGHSGAQSYFKAHKGGGRTSSRNLSGIQLPGHSVSGLAILQYHTLSHLRLLLAHATQEVVSMLKEQPKNPLVDQLAAHYATVLSQLPI
jgi:hypothetical protein